MTLQATITLCALYLLRVCSVRRQTPSMSRNTYGTLGVPKVVLLNIEHSVAFCRFFVSDPSIIDLYRIEFEQSAKPSAAR